MSGASLKKAKRKDKRLKTSKSAPKVPTDPVPSPLPSDDYMKIVDIPSVQKVETASQLIILDLNGTLVSRIGNEGATAYGMYVRPHQQQFLDYIFSHFKVMVWSSAKPTSVDRMCRLFGPYRDSLELIWDRTHFGLTKKAYNRKSQTIKNLEKIWTALDHKYDATNTILIDDSQDKSVLQPYNAIHIKTFGHRALLFKRHGEHELLNVILYLERLRTESNIANAIRTTPYVCTNAMKKVAHDGNLTYYYYNFYNKPDERQLVQVNEASGKPVKVVDVETKK